MATYTKVYNNPYPDGWQDGKDGNTPVTASILNNQTETIEAIEQYLADNPIEQGGGSSGTTDYEALDNKPTINGVEVVGDLSLEDLGITGGGGSGTTDYNDLSNKPSINGTELSGDITLDIPTKTSDLENDSGFLTEIPEQSYNDLTDKPQINGIDLEGNLTVEELGLLDITESTDTTLENSKDGILKIKTISGNTTQRTTSGKNQLDASGLTAQTINGMVFTPSYKDNGELEYVNVNGTSTATATYVISSEAKFTGGNSYVLNGCPSGGGMDKYFVAVSGNADFNDFGNGATSSFTEDTTTEVSIVVMSGVTVSNLKFYPMIRLASITDGTYEPHTAGKSPNPQFEQPIRSVVLSEIRTCGKNLWNYGDLWSRSFIYLCPINKGESVTLSYDFVNDDSGYDVRYGLYVMDSVNNWTIDNIVDHYADNKVISSVNGRNVITVTNNTYSVGYLYFRQIVPTGYARLSNIQVEVGSTATPYEPYTESVVTLSEPITLNGIGEVQDYIDAKRGVLVQRVDKAVVDGSESWSAYDGWANKTCFVNSTVLKNAVIILGYNTIPSLLSTHFEVVKANYLANTNNVNGISQGGGINLYISNTACATTDELKTWLTENNVTVYYELAEPIETPLPDADVEALKSLKSYDGVTHIFTDSEVEPDWFVEYNTTRVGTELDEIDAELVKINKRITDIGTTAQINYSTEEQVVGTWIDGRPIYQKTITDYDILNTENGTVLIAENLENLTALPEGVAESLSRQGITSHEVFPKLTTDQTYIIGVREQDKYVYIEKGTNISSNVYTYFKANITFKYIKTTDTV